MKLTKIVLFLLLSVNYQYIVGNEIDLYLKQVNLPADLESSSINTIMSDSAGFIWLATRNGLFRWDGLLAKQ